MADFHKEHVFTGRLVMLGFGCIGQGVLPLLLRHIQMRPEQLVIVSADEAGANIARAQGVHLLRMPVTAENLHQVLEPLLRAGDFLLNLSVDVSSQALIKFCRARGALYLDTCIEPWAGGYIDSNLAPAQRTNYALREAALALREPRHDAPTALLTHGANPGLVSHFVKQALLDLAQAAGESFERPTNRENWARLANCLGVRSIHIAERDTQWASRRRTPEEFVNTWSVDAFVSEACQPAELGWGSHERHFPADAMRHESGSRAAIYLQRPGAATWVRSWTPLAGAQHALLITHGESISIADYLTLGDPTHPDYRPTVHYAYRPCDDAVLSVLELGARNWRAPDRQRVLKDEIEGGIDELGVLLLGNPCGAYWYGSRLSIEQARALCPFNSATSLQVAAAAMAGVVWVMQNPARGVVEPDDLPFDRMLALSRPYLGELLGVFSHWTPLDGRGALFHEDVDLDDPWQFKNIRV
jgi:homospermidine synthase